MVQFGLKVSAQQEENEAWHYIDYKLLKQHIKDVCEKTEAGKMTDALGANAAFDKTLSSEISRVNECFDSTQAELLGRITGIADSAQGTTTWCAAATNQWLAGRQNFTGFVDVLHAIDKLRKFAVWNCVAVVKILKKRRKKTTFGLADVCQERVCWLSQQSFFNGTQFAELHAVAQSVAEMFVSAKLGKDSKTESTTQQQCPICLDYLSDAVELTCGHRCCWKCFVLGPIAYQPGEYRMSHCPICRSEAEVAMPSKSCACPPAASNPSAFSGGILSRFLYTYFGQDDEALTSAAVGRSRTASADSLEVKGKQLDDEMQKAVNELVSEVMGMESTMSRQESPKADAGNSDADASSAASGAAAAAADANELVPVPDDFFKTLPPKAAPDTEMAARQKLMWLQQASASDPLAIDDFTYCILCSEMLCCDAVVRTPCKHSFHKVCINRLKLPECPLCYEPLPFSWFLPNGHFLSESGFHVLAPEEYDPPFAGGPSIETGGFLLQQPPPARLLALNGSSMKSYIHKASPIQRDSVASQKASENPEKRGRSLSNAGGQRSNASSRSSSSSGSSEDSNVQTPPAASPRMPESPDFTPKKEEQLRDGKSSASRTASLLYGMFGPMQRYDAPLFESSMLPDPFAPRPTSQKRGDSSDDGSDDGQHADAKVVRLQEFI